MPYSKPFSVYGLLLSRRCTLVLATCLLSALKVDYSLRAGKKPQGAIHLDQAQISIQIFRQKILARA